MDRCHVSSPKFPGAVDADDRRQDPPLIAIADLPAVNATLNVILIPRYGMMGAAVATIAAYATMFAGMAWWSQRIYPVPYQWRRVFTAALVGAALVVAGKLAGGGLAVAFLFALAYPLVLLPLGFYLPAERRAIGARLRLAR